MKFVQGTGIYRSNTYYPFAGLYLLNSGFQNLFKTIVKKEELRIDYNIRIRNIERETDNSATWIHVNCYFQMNTCGVCKLKEVDRNDDFKKEKEYKKGGRNETA